LDSQSSNLYYITFTTATSQRALPDSVIFFKQTCIRQDALTEGQLAHSTIHQTKGLLKDGDKNCQDIRQPVSSPAPNGAKEEAQTTFTEEKSGSGKNMQQTYLAAIFST
jgi:hypothetical protein